MGRETEGAGGGCGLLPASFSSLLLVMRVFSHPDCTALPADSGQRTADSGFSVGVGVGIGIDEVKSERRSRLGADKEEEKGLGLVDRNKKKTKRTHRA